MWNVSYPSVNFQQHWASRPASQAAASASALTRLCLSFSICEAREASAENRVPRGSGPRSRPFSGAGPVQHPRWPGQGVFWAAAPKLWLVSSGLWVPCALWCPGQPMRGLLSAQQHLLHHLKPRSRCPPCRWARADPAAVSPNVSVIINHQCSDTASEMRLCVGTWEVCVVTECWLSSVWLSRWGPWAHRPVSRAPSRAAQTRTARPRDPRG